MKNQVKAYVNPNYDSEIGRLDVLGIIPTLTPSTFISFHHMDEVDEFIFYLIAELLVDGDKDIVLITYSLNPETGRPEARALTETGKVVLVELMLEEGTCVYLSNYPLDDLKEHVESTDLSLTLMKEKENDIFLYVISEESIPYEIMRFILNYIIDLIILIPDEKELDLTLLRNGVLMA